MHRNQSSFHLAEHPHIPGVEASALMLPGLRSYVPEFDGVAEARTGWLEEARRTVAARRSEDRFSAASERPEGQRA